MTPTTRIAAPSASKPRATCSISPVNVSPDPSAVAAARIMVLSRADDATEPQVGGARIDRLGHPRSGAVAAAVVRRAQVRPTLHDLARDAGMGQLGVVTSFGVAT